MSQFEVPFTQIAPYAQPSNWNNNRIGVDPLHALDQSPMPYVRYKDAASKLMEYLGVTPPYLPLQSYKTGDRFNADDHEHGTVFAYNLEMLDATRPFPEVNDKAHPNAPAFAPVAYTVGDEQLDDFVTMNHEGISYSRFMWWGVIAKTRRGNALLSLPGLALKRQPDGGITTTAHFELATPAFTIGEPFGNQKIPHGDAHSYNRVSAVDQMTYGASKKSSARIGGALLQKLMPSLRPGTA